MYFNFINHEHMQMGMKPNPNPNPKNLFLVERAFRGFQIQRT
jgi:hypothetical protein